MLWMLLFNSAPNFNLRAAQKIALASMQKCEAQVRADIEKFRTWMEKAQDHANRQVASLNLIFIWLQLACIGQSLTQPVLNAKSTSTLH